MNADGMHWTPYSEIDELLTSLLSRMRQILDKQLVGLYLYGSLVMGDFDRDISDIDLLAATETDIIEREFDLLQKMHGEFAAKHREWDDRIEVAYLSVTALKTFRTQRSPIAVISPGEPFHFTDAGRDWLVNWWVVRERGLPLYGPPPAAVIDPIAREEFLDVVQEHAKQWPVWVHNMQEPKGQAYAILTMCRALYTCENGEQSSKKQAARWAQVRLPQWAPLIQKALEWRVATAIDAADGTATFPKTVRFVSFVAGAIVDSERG